MLKNLNRNYPKLQTIVPHFRVRIIHNAYHLKYYLLTARSASRSLVKRISPVPRSFISAYLMSPQWAKPSRRICQLQSGGRFRIIIESDRSGPTFPWAPGPPIPLDGPETTCDRPIVVYKWIIVNICYLQFTRYNH